MLNNQSIFFFNLRTIPLSVAILLLVGACDDDAFVAHIILNGRYPFYTSEEFFVTYIFEDVVL